MADRDERAPRVIETGVPNLDRVLGGGVVAGSIAIIIGPPGIGKTLMAEQLVFHAASNGSRALYLTAYSETHDKLLSHTRGLRFFVPEYIGQQIRFASLIGLLQEGTTQTEDAIVATARAQRASLVVLDGFRSIRGFLSDDQEAARFMYSVGAKLALLGATTVVVIEGEPDLPVRYPELTVADVILSLRRERRGSRERRLLEVIKSRGSAHLDGTHPFLIDQDGLHIFPHFESSVTPAEPAWNPGRAGFGIDGVDTLLGGGLNVGTTTLAAGSPGVGKTLLGLSFAAQGVGRGEPVLFLGFMESAAQLREKARVFGLDLEGAEASGQVRFLTWPGFNIEADAVMDAARDDIEGRGVRRLVVDSAKEIERGVGSAERIPDFMSALVNYLRGRDVTSYLTMDINTIVGPELELAGTPLSVLAENLLLLRQVEYRGRLHRVFSVLKMRFSGHDRTIYEIAIKEGTGIEVVGPAPLGEGLLTGSVRLFPEASGPDQQNQS